MALDKTHINRIISGLVMLAVLAVCLFMGGWPLRILLCVAATLALWEFYQMFWPGYSRLPDKGAGLLTGILLCLWSGFDFGIAAPLVLLWGLFFYAALRFLFQYGSSDEKKSSGASLSEQALLVFGVIYLPASLQLATHMNLYDQLVVLLAAIASDTGAYYAGSLLGRHKIWPKVSPKKSLEGALGGLCASMIFLAFYSRIADIPGLEHLTLIHWAIIGLVLSCAAQLGDFFESALKRACKVKDSSKLIPGHGGLMDRLDSIIFVLPVYLFIRTFCSLV